MTICEENGAISVNFWANQNGKEYNLSFSS